MKGKKVTGISAKKSYYKVFLVLSLVLSLMMANSASAASLTVTSSGSKSIEVRPATGTAIVSDSINVATDCRYGYNFAIQTSVDDNNLYLDGDSNNVDAVFSPASGYALNETTNEWGYFYDYDFFEEEDIVPDSSFGFWPVPVLSEEPVLIKFPLDEPSLSDINDSFNIYYGVSVGYDVVPGTYKMIPDESDNDGTIVYIATVAEECANKYTVHFSPTSIFDGITLTGSGTMDVQVIDDGITTNLDANGFYAPNGYMFAGWNTAQDGSGTQYYDGEAVTDIAGSSSSITLYAQWTNCFTNKICYSPNVADLSEIEGEMDNQSPMNTDTSVVLHASNFSRDGYGFVGWNTRPDGTGTYYGPNQTIEFNWIVSGSVPGLRLYAQWVASAGNMQNWSGCSSMSIGDITALKDTRDDDVYAVAKLADGKCWMIENLRLDNTALHNSDGTLAQGYASSFVGLANPESAHFNGNDSTANSIYSTDGSTAVRITGNYVEARIPRYNNTNTSSRYTGSSDLYGNSNTYSYGNYYTWAAAIADTGYYATNGQSITTTSICPLGWHLPTGGASGEAYALNTAVNAGATDSTASNALRSYPNNFLYSGDFSYTSPEGRGNGGWGVYWTPMVGDQFFAYVFEMYTGGVEPGFPSSGGSGRSKAEGYTIRCIAGT